MSENFKRLVSIVNIPTFGMPNFGLNSILDILFIAFVIYQLMMWIKQTRAWTLFKGIIVVIIAFCLSYIMELDAITWIMSKTLSVALIGVVVIFQPELRKALEKLGKGKMVSLLNTFDDNDRYISPQTVEEIITAVVKMSKVRTGALLVIEQQVALGDLESTGVRVDAVVSSQLLINIFENKTPLHDGAVLIRDNRVSAATCILPLTQDHLSSDLGTRHRAAVGASEVSDAYVLVVSEETGGISIAKEGKLYRHLSDEDIRHMLTENIKPAKAPKEGKTGLWKGRRKK